MKKKSIIFLTLVLLPFFTAKAVSVPNPLGNVNSLPDLIGRGVQGFLGISGALALLFVVWGGITWMTSRGNAEKVKSGRDAIVWALFGLVAVFLSYVIISAVLGLLQGTS